MKCLPVWSCGWRAILPSRVLTTTTYTPYVSWTLSRITQMDPVCVRIMCYGGPNSFSGIECCTTQGSDCFSRCEKSHSFGLCIPLCVGPGWARSISLEMHKYSIWDWNRGTRWSNICNSVRENQATVWRNCSRIDVGVHIVVIGTIVVRNGGDQRRWGRHGYPGRRTTHLEFVIFCAYCAKSCFCSIT